MDSNLLAFMVLAASVGFVHTLLGPDHYLPFIVLSKARRWSLTKTIWITVGCGLGHVLSSVVLGFLGIGFGWAVGELVAIEDQRGTIAGWLLLSLGVLYTLWGIKRAILGKSHSHSHAHGGISHVYDHHHDHGHFHEHQESSNTTPWVLFLIFVFGPCEPLIPVLMYPAVQKDLWTLAAVVSVFAIVTIATMLGAVVLAFKGLSFVKVESLQRWSHALAGGAMTVVAVGMVFLGW